MPEKPTYRLTEPADNLDDYAEHAEYLKDPIYQVFERWDGEQAADTPQRAATILRPWCGNRFTRTLAFDLALTAADKQLLRELGIRP